METTQQPSRLCIVGAGLAGAGVAYALGETPTSVTILEKSRGVGGRAATRRRDGCRYDHGANYVKDSDDRTTRLLESLGTDGLVDVEGPVWPFDSTGEITESERPEAHKWTWEAGITQFAKRLLAETDATVHTATRVASLRRVDDGDSAATVDNDFETPEADTDTPDDDSVTVNDDFDSAAGDWWLTDTDGDEHGPFDAVVLTPPAPQTAALLESTRISGGRDALATAIEAVEDVDYRTIRSVLLHYPFELDRPYYALVNTDREHAIGWLSRESCKAGHVPDGEELLVVQMAPDWSGEHYDEPLAAVENDVAAMAASLLSDDRLTEPDWVDDQGWRYALPETAVDDARVAPLAGYGLHVAGDWVVGEGRAHAAFWNGVALGDRLTDT